MEDIVQGFNKEKDSLMLKIGDVVDGYILAKLKRDELRRTHAVRLDMEKEYEENMLFHKDEIIEIILQDADIQWLKTNNQ